MTEYNLIPIGQLDNADSIADNDFIVSEISRPGTGSKTVRIRKEQVLTSANTKLDNAGSLQIDILDPIFDSVRDQLPDQLETQDDMNLLLTNTVTAVVNKVNAAPEVIISPTRPIKLDITGAEIPYNEGTLWIDPANFRTYVMFYDRDPNHSDPNQVLAHIWVGLTDR